MGTLLYMSPEQVRGEPLDVRTDLFSFGAVLYEMATGRPAFSGETAGQVRDAILSREPTSARKLNPRVPTRLERVITKALRKKPQERYQRASELRAQLSRVRGEIGTRWRRRVALAALGLVRWPSPRPSCKFRLFAVSSNAVRRCRIAKREGAETHGAEWPSLRCHLYPHL